MILKKPLLIILYVGIIVYSNTLYCPFHYDDVFIINNPAVRNILDLQSIWNYWPYRFITFLSFALNYHFHQFNVLGYHLFNVMVHVGSAMMVFWLTLLTLSTPAMKGQKIVQHARYIALFAGLIFVSHPVQTEAVTFIWQRTASMATFFYLASLSLYVKSRMLSSPVSSGQGKAYYLCSLIMAILAMFTKEMTITLPLMILLYEGCFLKTRNTLNWKPVSPFLLMLFIIPVTMLVTRSVHLKGLYRVTEDPPQISSMHYLLTQFRVMVTYIRLVFFPVNQNLDYDYPKFKSFFEPQVVSSFLFLGMVLCAAKRLFSKYRVVSFSIFWFFLALLPESSFLPLKDVIAEHRLYLPLAGYSLFLASSVYYLFEKTSIKTIGLVLMMIVFCNSVLTCQRNNIWKNELTLWDDTVKKSPHKARPRYNRGNAYYYLGQYPQALADYNGAIGKGSRQKVMYENRALAYYQLKEYDKAWADVDKAEDLGDAVDPVFIGRLKKSSGKDNNVPQPTGPI